MKQDKQLKIKKKTFYFGTAIIALIITTAIVAGISSAHGFNDSSNFAGMNKGNHQFHARQNYSPERHIAMQEAFANKDYDAWKALMPEQAQVTTIINKDNFPRFVEMHDLMISGDYDDANAIRQELGLSGHQSRGMHRHADCPFMQDLEGK